LDESEADLASFVLGASTVHVPPELLGDASGKKSKPSRLSFPVVLLAMVAALLLGVGVFAGGLMWFSGGEDAKTPSPASAPSPVSAPSPLDVTAPPQVVEVPETIDGAQGEQLVEEESSDDKKRRRSSESRESRRKEKEVSEADDSPWNSTPPVDAVETTRSGGFKDPTRQVKVRLSGDAEAVWLVTADEKIGLPTSVYPGRYEIHALFEGAVDAVVAGEIQIEPGGTQRIRCDAFLLRCR
jgi:hypothetical protein